MYKRQLLGAAQTRTFGKGIVVSGFEHPSVQRPLERLAAQGYHVTVVAPQPDGTLDMGRMLEAVDKNTILVACMMVNNEIGTRNDVERLAAEVKRRNSRTIVHVDAVQAWMRVPIKLDNIDTLAVSGHKIHAPKGVGALYLSDRLVQAFQPPYLGGEQERGHRAGTENVAGIVGAAAAFAEAMSERNEKADRLCAMRDEIQSGLLKIPGSQVNGVTAPRLPGTLNMSFDGIDGQSLIFELDLKGLAASSGSACASGSVNPSHVLLALGLPYKLAHGSLRLSLGRYNTPDEAEKIIRIVSDTVAELRG